MNAGKTLFEWAPFRSTKAAIKLHTLLDLRGTIPAFIHISDGKLHDVNVLDMLTFEAGAFYVMDRGYVDFERLYALHQAGALFVTQAKSPMDARRVYSAPTERDTGVICDQRVMLNGDYSARKCPEHRRRIRFKAPESDKTLVCRVHLRADRHRQKRASPQCLALHIFTDPVGVRHRENRYFMRLAGRRLCDRPAHQR